MTKNLIIYITPVLVNLSSAATKRILANAHLLKRLDYNITICSGENSVKSQYKFESINIVPTGNSLEAKKGISKLFAYNKSVANSVAYLNTIKKENIKAVIIYSGYTPYIVKLKKWCKQNNIPLIFDAVEWYTPPKKIHWLINPYYWNTEYAMRFLIPKIKNVISISKFLDEYYTQRECNSVIIPPLFYKKNEVKRINTKRNNSVISYTGSPGKKDELNIILAALLKYNQKSNKISFEIAGINEQQLLQYEVFKKQKTTSLPSFIKTFGWVTMKEAQQITINAKFSILLRKKNKTTIAGFPTKVVESLSLGTPLIINYTSDLKKYIIDKENAYICQELSIESLCQVFDKIVAIKDDEYLQMRDRAILCANKNFNVDNNLQNMTYFLEKLKK